MYYFSGDGGTRERLYTSTDCQIICPLALGTITLVSLSKVLSTHIILDMHGRLSYIIDLHLFYPHCIFPHTQTVHCGLT